MYMQLPERTVLFSGRFLNEVADFLMKYWKISGCDLLHELCVFLRGEGNVFPFIEPVQR